MKCSGFNPESYGFYALGLADEQERTVIAEHLEQGCETCRDEVQNYQAVWNAVALEAPEVAPRPSLRKLVLAGCERDSRRGLGTRIQEIAMWLRPALVLAGVASLTVVLTSYICLQTIPNPRLEIAFAPVLPNPPAPSELAALPPAVLPRASADTSADITALQADLAKERETNDRLLMQIAEQSRKRMPPPEVATSSEDFAKQRQAFEAANARSEEILNRLRSAVAQIASLEREVSQYKTLLELQRKRADNSVSLASMVVDPRLRMIPVKGTERGKGIEGRVLITGDARMLFVATNFPKLPDNRVYQVWLIRSASPAIASAGVFQPGVSGQASIQTGDASILTNVKAVAVTDEPVGGSSQPTGAKWAIGL